MQRRPNNLPKNIRKAHRPLVPALFIGLSTMVVGCEPLIHNLVLPFDTGGPADTASTADCLVPDHVDLSRAVGGVPGVHFYIPDNHWTLALAESQWALDQTVPGWSNTDLLALALEVSAMGCVEAVGDAEHGVQWARDPAADALGCFGVEETATWTDLCRVFPGHWSCDTYGSAIPRLGNEDHVVSGIWAATHYAVFVDAFLTQHGATDPKAWLDAATDPAVRTKILLVAWLDSPFSTELTNIVANCADQPIESCINRPDLAIRVERAGQHALDLRSAMAAGSCASNDVTADQVERYGIQLTDLFIFEDIQALQTAGLAIVSAGDDLNEVRKAIYHARRVPLACPEDTMNTWYGFSCP